MVFYCCIVWRADPAAHRASWLVLPLRDLEDAQHHARMRAGPSVGPDRSNSPPWSVQEGVSGAEGEQREWGGGGDERKTCTRGTSANEGSQGWHQLVGTKKIRVDGMREEMKEDLFHEQNGKKRKVHFPQRPILFYFFIFFWALSFLYRCLVSLTAQTTDLGFWLFQLPCFFFSLNCPPCSAFHSLCLQL